MSTSKLTYTEFATAGYLSNVASATRQLLAALLAVKPRTVAPAVTVIEQPVSRSWLHALAEDCERHSPNLSAELRFMASRG